MNKNDISYLMADSWLRAEGMYTNEELLEWIASRKRKTFVDIKKTTLAATGWFYERTSCRIMNKSRSFFQIAGFKLSDEKNGTHIEQPIIIQDEIGYLGILCKVFDGVLHFLMQAKIEPGNVNKIQISPTIQATKSNFTQRHGGAQPKYLEYFLSASRHAVIADQIQSEQSSRFYKKRNRNIIVMLDGNEDVAESQNHRWMTLGQIKKLMKIDNLVNMDTRTVFSGITFIDYKEGLNRIIGRADDPALVRSIINGVRPEALTRIYNYINDFKMFSEARTEFLPLYSLENWENWSDGSAEEFKCKTGWPFKLIFCDISIEGREVRHWGQPLFEAVGMAYFGLYTAVKDGVRKFLVHAAAEAGCFDKIELGPTIQMEATDGPQDTDEMAKSFLSAYERREGIKYDVVLSEEGGRFYQEQNRNIVIEISENDITELPEGYFWVTYHTLNLMTRFNNCLNIQLRNLLSLLEL